MFLSLLLIIILTSSLVAQEFYIYPNKRLADEGLLEYRRYTLDEAREYEKGGSFAPYLITYWSNEIRLTEDEDAYAPKVVTVGDSIFCTYQTIYLSRVFFIRSTNAGIDWDQNICLADTTDYEIHYYPEIIQNNNQLLVGFSVMFYEPHVGRDFGYRISSDYGESWGDLGRVFGYLRDDVAHFSSLCNSDSRIFWSYNEYYRDSLYVVSSPNWGQSWNGRGVNVAYLSGTPQPMTIRSSGDNVYLVWVNEVGTISVHYSRSTDEGLTWSDEIEFTDDPDGAQRCFVAVQDTHVVVSWKGYKYSDYAFTGDLFIKQSFDSGATWCEEQVLTDLGKVWMGSVYIEDSLIVACWQDDRYMDTDYDDEVFAKYSTDYGETWTEEERLSYGYYHSQAPISCRTSSEVHVLWGDMRSNAPGLYYCSNDLTTGVYDISSIPDNIRYLSSYPNPFNSSTIITYSNLKGCDIEIYNLNGQLVKTLLITGKEGKIAWDPTDASGEKVSSGIYFAKAETPQSNAIIKLVYLK